MIFIAIIQNIFYIFISNIFYIIYITITKLTILINDFEVYKNLVIDID